MHAISGPARKRRVLIIVENLPVPFNQRVWQQATALAGAGWTVSVICPKGPGGTEVHETIDGIEIFRHALPFEASGMFGFIAEYAVAFAAETLLAWKIFFRRGFDVIQAGNPPDNIFLVALPFKALFGTRFVYDHLDPCPEMFEVKFPSNRLIHRATLLFERLTLRFADWIIETSEGQKNLLVRRWGADPARISLVRSVPDIAKLPDVRPDPNLRENRRYLVAYMGVMGAQDGVDLLLDAASIIVHELGRTDVHFGLAGDGPHAAALRARCAALGLGPFVTFHGYLTGEPLYRLLASADVAACPDPPNAYNDISHMNKVADYMAYRLPVVMFDLAECRLIAGDAGEYALDADPADFARRLVALLDDPDRRRRMGDEGKRRLDESLNWATQARIYLDAYAKLMAGRERNPG